MESKVCGKCGDDKPLDQFYPRPGRAGGVRGECKMCARLGMRADYAANREQRKAKAKARYQRVGRIKEKDPRKRKAWAMVNIRVQRGTMIRPDACQECGTAGKVEAHHEDYDKPLEVVWLCRVCHENRHANEKFVPSTPLTETPHDQTF